MKTSIEKFRLVAACAAIVVCCAEPAAAVSQVDLIGGVLSYRSLNGVASQLKIAAANSAYTVDDPAETSILLGPEAVTAGCTAFDNNTVTCPDATITSLQVFSNDLADFIDLSKSGVPALVDSQFSDDTVIGTPFADTFVWNPGGSSDTIDGGGGDDQLLFNGSNANETITIRSLGDGFELFRDVANIHMVVSGVENLVLTTLGGTDVVHTAPLVATAQSLVDGDDGGTTDRLDIDAGGLCVTRTGDTFDIDARQPISIVRFTDVLVLNSFCIADPCATAAPTGGCTVNGVKNQLCQGSDADDVIVGTKASDVIKAGPGNDRVRALDGDDVVCGEEGDDVISGGSGNDRLFGGDGDDTLKGDAGNDLLAGQRDDDSLSGGGGDDEVDGGSGNDRVRGLGGNDVLRGGAGTDRIDGGPGLDFCTDIEVLPPFPRCEAP
jgi:Ca2+-binding RTX toxin-like protein